MGDTYVIDSSPLIELERLYPVWTFPTLWEKFAVLAEEGRAIAPIEVRKEVCSKKGFLCDWCKEREGMFHKIVGEAWNAVEEIVEKYPGHV